MQKNDVFCPKNDIREKFPLCYDVTLQHYAKSFYWFHFKNSTYWTWKGNLCHVDKPASLCSRSQSILWLFFLFFWQAELAEQKVLTIADKSSTMNSCNSACKHSLLTGFLWCKKASICIFRGVVGCPLF